MQVPSTQSPELWILEGSLRTPGPLEGVGLWLWAQFTYCLYCGCVRTMPTARTVAVHTLPTARTVAVHTLPTARTVYTLCLLPGLWLYTLCLLPGLWLYTLCLLPGLWLCTLCLLPGLCAHFAYCTAIAFAVNWALSIQTVLLQSPAVYSVRPSALSQWQQSTQSPSVLSQRRQST